MCGISGIYSSSTTISALAIDGLRAAGQRLTHRGPDEYGEMIQPNFCAVHNRLSIIDIACGKQPMLDAATGNAIVYNGEIYNFVELRRMLQGFGHHFRTDSDTEVLLKCYLQYGNEMCEHLNGMFAFAIYDANANEVLIGRDRFGEKPFYYFQTDDRFCFASELEALTEFDRCPRQRRQAALEQYFIRGTVPGPKTMLEGVFQLMPGHFARISATGLAVKRYYQVPSGLATETLNDEAIEQALSEAIGMRLRADVPVATLLSGGIDSSLITILAQRQKTQPLHTFAFGWAGQETELPWARQIAEKVQTTHHEILLEQAVFNDDIEAMCAAMDMPNSDSATFVGFELSKEIARNGVKVVLSGEGGDELFGGYDWYKNTGGTRQAVKSLLRGRSRISRDYLLNKIVFSSEELQRAFGRDPIADYLSHSVADYPDLGNSVNARIVYDYENFIPWMLMPKVDRMSMAHSIEIRAPLLDHKLIAQWALVPEHLKAANNMTKIRIKQYCLDAGILNQEQLTRKKMGMNLPLTWWLRSNESMFRDTLTSEASVAVELFGREMVEHWFEELAQQTIQGWTITAQKIWACFVLDLWCRRLGTSW